jgi:hypothetical protein
MITSDVDKSDSSEGSLASIGRQQLLEAEMRGLAVTEERHSKYRYGEFVYDNLESAMAYARLERDRNKRRLGLADSR